MSELAEADFVEWLNKPVEERRKDIREAQRVARLIQDVAVALGMSRWTDAALVADRCQQVCEEASRMSAEKARLDGELGAAVIPAEKVWNCPHPIMQGRSDRCGRFNGNCTDKVCGYLLK